MTNFLLVLALIAFSFGTSENPPSFTDNEGGNTKERILQKDMLLGEFQKEELQQKPFASWFEPTYKNFTPNSEAMEIIKKNIGDYDIKLFMGTWCGDSKRETPKFLRILDEADYDYDNIDMYAVDHSKTTPAKAEEELNIQRVPTIIFYKNGKEVNRFVEYSQGESIEDDIAKILSGVDYKNSYAD